MISRRSSDRLIVWFAWNRFKGGSMAQGFVLYRGPSLLDGAPIIAIATLESSNVKTGDMIQTWIMREDYHPLDAIASGLDRSICGSCTHRPVNGGTCYVDVAKAPSNVWRTFHAGGYIDLSDDDDIETVQALTAGRHVRIGAYGDPAAVSPIYWHRMLWSAAGHAGYTHQWKDPRFQDLRSLCMASVDSEHERSLAQSMGWRTFRVRSESQVLLEREIACPASLEGGNARQCINCQACDGADRPGKSSVTIVVHGYSAKRFVPA